MANGQKRAYHKLDFSLEEEESLIDFVKQNNVLYNPKHRDYKNKMFRDRIWEDIAATLKKTGNILACTVHVGFIHYISLLNSTQLVSFTNI